MHTCRYPGQSRSIEVASHTLHGFSRIGFLHLLVRERTWVAGIDVDTSICVRCNREITPGSKSVAVYMFSQTVGIKPRLKSTAQRICFCPQCSVSLAMGPPPEGALNIVAWNMIRDLVSSDPALSQAAWQGMQDVIALPPADEVDIPRRAIGNGGYFEF